MELKGKVTIVAGFPAIGKAEATSYLHDQPGFRVINISFKHYFYASGKHDVDMENMYRSYVHSIMSSYQTFLSNQCSNPDADETAYVIFVDGDVRIRELLSEMQMSFIYVAPDLESFNTLVAAAKARLADEPDYVPYQKDVEYLESPEALESVKRTAEGDIPYIGQMETYTIPFGTYTEDHRFVSIATLIEDMFHPSDDFKGMNQISELQSIRLGHVFKRYLLKSLPNLSAIAECRNDHRIGPETDGSPSDWEDENFKYQIGFDHYGRIIRVITPKNPVTMALKTTYAVHAKTQYGISNKNKTVFLEDLRLRSRCGYFGLDSIMLNWNSAMVLSDMIDKIENLEGVSFTEEEKAAIADLEVAVSGAIPSYTDMIQNGTAEEVFDERAKKLRQKILQKETKKNKKEK